LSVLSSAWCLSVGCDLFYSVRLSVVLGDLGSLRLLSILTDHCVAFRTLFVCNRFAWFELIAIVMSDLATAHMYAAQRSKNLPPRTRMVTWNETSRRSVSKQFDNSHASLQVPLPEVGSGEHSGRSDVIGVPLTGILQLDVTLAHTAGKTARLVCMQHSVQEWVGVQLEETGLEKQGKLPCPHGACQAALWQGGCGCGCSARSIQAHQWWLQTSVNAWNVGCMGIEPVHRRLHDEWAMEFRQDDMFIII
jgi:hypothetical protein